MRTKLLMAAVAALASSGVVHADQYRQLDLTGTVSQIEGNPPFGVGIGAGIEFRCVVAIGTPDSEPATGVGRYFGAATFPYIRMTSLDPFSDFLSGSVEVENNQSFRDLLRVQFFTSDFTGSVTAELIDGDSTAFASEAVPTTLALPDFTGKFDFTQIVVDFTDPSNQWRAVCSIDTLAYIAITCRCDWNASDSINSQDFFDFLTDFFTGRGDYNGDGTTNSQDFFDFLACFFEPEAHCP